MANKNRRDLRSTCVSITILLAIGLLIGLFASSATAADAKLIEKAKKEGQVVYLSNVIGTDTNAALVKAFMKRYNLPKSFQVKHALIKSGQLVSKVDAELKAGFATMDIISASVPSFLYGLKKKGELMKYHSPEEKHYAWALKSQVITGEAGYWVAPNAYTFVLMWNPKYIKKDLTSWKDVLNPEYKGKIVMGDPIKSATYCQSYIALRKVMDKAFFKKLAAQKVFFGVASERIADHCATGEYPIAFWGMPTRAYQRAKIGINLKVGYPKEGSMLLGQPFAILAKAPHPNAAKLWIDFMYSKEAQTIHMREEGLSPVRKDLDVPDLVQKFTPPVDQIESLPLKWSAIGKKDIAAARKEFQEIFKR